MGFIRVHFSASLLIAVKPFIMWSVIDMQMEENKRQWKGGERRNNKKKKDIEKEKHTCCY